MAADPKNDKDPRDESPDPRESPAAEEATDAPETPEAEGADEAGQAPAEPEAGDADSPEAATDLSDDDLALLADAERDLVAEYRERAARAEAELKNFRTRVERDRQANREAVIAEVLRNLLPVIDDLDRADTHGDLVEGSPLAIIAQKLRGGFDRYGLQRVGEKGDPFDPKLHEAIAQVYSKDVTVETIADVIEPGYALGDRLLRAAKVAVSVPEPS